MFKLDYKTKYITVVIEFDYNSSTSRNIPNDLRESFMGLSQSKERPKARGTPDFPQRIKERCKYEREIIYPLHFSLIKKPVTMHLPGTGTYKTRNTAVGAIILYKYQIKNRLLGNFNTSLSLEPSTSLLPSSKLIRIGEAFKVLPKARFL